LNKQRNKLADKFSSARSAAAKLDRTPYDDPKAFAIVIDKDGNERKYDGVCYSGIRGIPWNANCGNKIILILLHTDGCANLSKEERGPFIDWVLANTPPIFEKVKRGNKEYISMPINKITREMFYAVSCIFRMSWEDARTGRTMRLLCDELFNMDFWSSYAMSYMLGFHNAPGHQCFDRYSVGDIPAVCLGKLLHRICNPDNPEKEPKTTGYLGFAEQLSKLKIILDSIGEENVKKVRGPELLMIDKVDLAELYKLPWDNFIENMAGI